MTLETPEKHSIQNDVEGENFNSDSQKDIMRGFAQHIMEIVKENPAYGEIPEVQDILKRQQLQEEQEKLQKEQDKKEQYNKKIEGIVEEFNLSNSAKEALGIGTDKELNIFKEVRNFVKFAENKLAIEDLQEKFNLSDTAVAALELTKQNHPDEFEKLRSCELQEMKGFLVYTNFDEWNKNAIDIPARNGLKSFNKLAPENLKAILTEYGDEEERRNQYKVFEWRTEGYKIGDTVTHFPVEMITEDDDKLVRFLWSHGYKIPEDWNPIIEGIAEERKKDLNHRRDRVKMVRYLEGHYGLNRDGGILDNQHDLYGFGMYASRYMKENGYLDFGSDSNDPSNTECEWYVVPNNISWGRLPLHNIHIRCIKRTP